MLLVGAGQLLSTSFDFVLNELWGQPGGTDSLDEYVKRDTTVTKDQCYRPPVQSTPTAILNSPTEIDARTQSEAYQYTVCECLIDEWLFDHP